ncbi:MAG: hypothetical protein IJU50_08650 [Lachnospiraceae bacterium]|nr:hypothetical protein [Lachnospiraceae bacterium]
MSIRGIVKEMLINQRFLTDRTDWPKEDAASRRPIRRRKRFNQRFLKNKKTVCIGLVLLNVLLALFGGVSLLIALNQDFACHYTENQILLYRGQGDQEVPAYSSIEEGFYLDHTYDGDRLYLGSPETTLFPGIYQVRISYHTEDAKLRCSIVCPEAGDKSYHYVENDQVSFSDTGEKSLQIRIRKLGNYIVQNRFEGRQVPEGITGWAMVPRIDIAYAPKASAASLLGKMIAAFLCLNGIGYFLLSEGFRALLQKNRIPIFVTVLLCLFSSYPLFTNYGFSADDLDHFFLRVEGLSKGLKMLSFPVKVDPFWIEDRGYAESVFYGNLLLHFPALLRLFQVPLFQVWKAYILFINLLTASVSVYSFLRLGKNRHAAYGAACLYVLFPHRLFDLYVRTAAGEYTAAAFLPLVLLGLYEIFQEEPEEKSQGRKGVVFLVIGLSGIITAHFLSTYLTGWVISVFVCCIIKKQSVSKHL